MLLLAALDMFAVRAGLKRALDEFMISYISDAVVRLRSKAGLIRVRQVRSGRMIVPCERL